MHKVVIRINSFSKMLAPGLRLGWITAVRPIVDQLAIIKQQVDPHTQNLSQLVVSELVDDGTFDRHLGTLRAEHRRRRDAMAAALRQHVPAGALRFAVPDGGMYLWCQLAMHVTAAAVHEEALKDGVVVVTGAPFYVDQGGAHQLRVCYTSQTPARAEHAARVLARSVTAAARRPSGDASSGRLV
jgi:2-aminoadipate transaminase